MKESLLGSSPPPKIDLFPKEAHSVIAQTFAESRLKRQQQVAVLWVAEEGLFVSALLLKE